ncbi:peptidoglycan editing factor PgeF [Sporichthya polymorpha]|uniref:peptidoglycan editing factor PgeF n=1 Tax=Sporichthya polymorpha TaxID=35751 RepID=UPI0003684A37|nr:peptidoglycan editing factor PgeF [Sporichthya polymorpha]
MIPLLMPSWPPGVRGVFTTRAGGQSIPPYAELNLATHVGDDARTVAANRVLVAAAVGLSPEQLVFMDQVHGNDVAVVDGPVAVPPVADALVTSAPGLALVVLVADCVPVLMADPYAGVVAAAHAGRKGVESGVVAQALRVMQDLGAEPGRVRVQLGPSINGCCYEVPESMQREVAAAAPGAVAGTGRTRAGTPSLDLRPGLAEQFAALGVRDVGLTGGCTHDDPDFFSYRRDGVTGRFAGLIWREPDPASRT